MLPDFRTIQNSTNDWMIDRDVQKNETFTGIEGINAQDQAVQESMGAIGDRSREHLANSDMAIVAARACSWARPALWPTEAPSRHRKFLLQRAGHRQHPAQRHRSERGAR
jgi:hypothetical protein